MQHEYHMAELQIKQFQIPNDQVKSFEVEVAAKLLSKCFKQHALVLQ